jgi:TonB-linked SusC/RagA family outer membrane protein
VSEADNITTGLGNLQVTSSLGHGFGLDLSVGGNYWQRDYGEYLPSTVNEGRSSGGDAVHSNNNFANVLSTNLLRFNRDFDAHNRLDVVGGYEITNNRSNWLQNEVRGFPNDILGGNVLQSGTDPQRPVSGTSVDKLTSWLGRANYALFDRYLFTGTIRADGSSKFAENNKWAVFPALAFAWRALDEPLLQNQTMLSELKVRMSYGKSGNQAIGAYQSSGALDPCTTTVGDVLQPCYAVSRLPNPNLKWETTSQYDVGVDFGMMKNRLTATADVYRKNTYDLLQSITVADNTGITSALINSGNVTNRGFELQVGYDLLTGQGTGRIGALKWNLSANASHNKNRIVSLGLDTATKQQFASRLGAGGGLEVTPFIQKPGVSIGSMYGYVSDGLIRTAADSVAYKTLSGTSAHIGDYRYRDLDGDGKLTSADQRIIGDANPRWTWGVSNRLSLGNFDVSAFVTAVVGGDIINTERIRYLDLNGTINVPSEFVRNSFDPTTNPNGIYPMIRQDRRGDNRFSDLFIENGTYVRLKNVQVGYNLSLPHMPTARLYANGINLATWTKYKGFDPEVSAFGGSDRPGVDIGSYPNSKLITVGLSTTF